MSLKDAFLNIGTLGYYSYRQSLKLKSELESQSRATGSATSPTLVASVNRTGLQKTAQLSQDAVSYYRYLSKANPWIRAAFNIYRNTLTQTDPTVVPYNPKKPMKKAVKTALESLIAHPSQRNTPYSTLWEMVIDDYLSVGYGAIEKILDGAVRPVGLEIIDAGRLGFNPAWNGQPTQPHYALLEAGSTRHIERWMHDEQAMVLLNSPFSYSELGTSHVASLVSAVESLVEGDEFLKNQVLTPVASGLIDLGNGSTPQQAEQASVQMRSSKYPILVTSGMGNSKFVPFNSSPKDLQILEAQKWFVQQVAAIFGLPPAMLQLEWANSNANAESMLKSADTSLGQLLGRKRDLENQELTLKFGPYDEHNCYLDYPAYSQRDASTQTDISTKRYGAGLSTLNEERGQNGLEPLPYRIADQILITVQGAGPVPLEALEQKYYPDGKLVEPPAPAPTPDSTQAPTTDENENEPSKKDKTNGNDDKSESGD